MEPIGQLIRRVVKESGKPNPHDSLDAVIAEIPAEDYEARLREIIPHIMSSAVAHETRATVKTLTKALEKWPYQGSPKQRMIHDDWKAFKKKPLYISDGRWIEWGKATAANLYAAAAIRSQKAAELAAAGDRLEKIADLMQERGVATVSELEGSVVMELAPAA